MTTGVYTYGAAGRVSLLDDDLKALLVTQLYNPHLDIHRTLDDIPEAAKAASAVALTNRTLTGTVFDANDLRFPGVPEGLGFPITGVVLYAANTGILLGYFDYFYNLPLVPDGRDVALMWPDDASRIFSWE